MEKQEIQAGHIIEVDIDLTPGASAIGGNKICGGAPCDFSDMNNSSKDAKERSASIRKLLIAVILCVIFMSVEVAGGIAANSLAILTDAAHLLSDVAAFAISLFSLWAFGWEATPQQSYGFFRVEILGALVSIQLIWLLAGILVYEAIARILRDNGEVQMFLVSVFGLLINIIMAVMLGHEHGHSAHSHGHSEHDHGHNRSRKETDHSHSQSDDDHDHHHIRSTEHGHGHSTTLTTHHHHTKEEQVALLQHSEHSQVGNSGVKQRNINVHSAYLHVLEDSAQSIVVMIGGAAIWYRPEWKIVDLICTLIFSVVVLLTTIKMLGNILEVLMESTPREIDATKLEKGLCEMDGVVAVHELHIWAITIGKILLACHVVITREADADLVLDQVIGYIRREYNISHVTIQIERQ